MRKGWSPPGRPHLWELAAPGLLVAEVTGQGSPMSKQMKAAGVRGPELYLWLCS